MVLTFFICDILIGWLANWYLTTGQLEKVMGSGMNSLHVLFEEHSRTIDNGSLSLA